MTKPADDFEAVRMVTEALQGFDAQDQERIIRWAREKLNLVATPVAPLPKAIVPIPPAKVSDPAPPPVVTPPNRNLTLVERLPPEAPEVQHREVQPPIAWQPEARVAEVEAYEAEPSAAEQPAEPQPEVVNVLMPEPEHKNRLPLLIGIIVLVVALTFLVFMIVSSHPK